MIFDALDVKVIDPLAEKRLDQDAAYMKKRKIISDGNVLIQSMEAGVQFP